MNDHKERLRYGPCDDLRRVLPAVTGLLSKGASRLSTDALTILSGEMLDREYMNHETARDEVVTERGLSHDLPFVHNENGVVYDEESCGIRIYQTKGELKYAEVTIPNPHHLPWLRTLRYFVLLKSDEESLREHIAQSNISLCANQKPPVLAEGLLDDLVSNTIKPLLEREKLAKYDVRLCRGVILDGPPGNGKTMVCKWLKKLCIDNRIDFGRVSAAEIDYRYNSGGRQVYDLFNMFTVTFFDDVGMSFLNRLRGHDEKACDILSAMDGVDECNARIRVFTTNEEIKEIDEAFMRPGRIDVRYHLEKPDSKLRQQLVEIHWTKELRDWIKDGYLGEFLNRSEGFSFADLESIRTLLVDEKVFGSGEWNLEAAFQKLESRKISKSPKTRSVGFNR